MSNGNSKIVLFADDTSKILTNPDPANFKNSVIKIFQDINTWFSASLSAPNIDKTHFTQCVTKNISLIDLYVTHENKKIVNICNTKFLGVTLDSSLTWKTHIDTIILN